MNSENTNLLTSFDEAVPQIEEKKEDNEVNINSNILFIPQRLNNETYSEYKERRLVAHYKNHMMAKGTLIWNSRPDPNAKGNTFRKTK